MNEHDLLQEINKRLIKIESYLYNDEDTGKDGVVKSLDKLQKDVYLIKEERKIEKAQSAWWGIIGGSALTGTIKLIEKFL